MDVDGSIIFCSLVTYMIVLCEIDRIKLIRINQASQTSTKIPPSNFHQFSPNVADLQR